MSYTRIAFADDVKVNIMFLVFPESSPVQGRKSYTTYTELLRGGDTSRLTSPIGVLNTDKMQTSGRVRIIS